MTGCITYCVPSSPTFAPRGLSAGRSARGGERKNAILRTPFAGEPGRHYLLRLRRDESPALVVNLIGPGWSRVDGPYRRPGGSGVERIMLHPSEVPAGTQLGIAFSPPGNLRITELELYELAPSYGLLPPLVRLLAPLVALVFCVRHWRWLAGRPAPGVATSAWDRRLLAVALLLVCFLAFYEAPVYQVFDSSHLSVVSHALLTHGTTAIPVELLAVDRGATAIETMNWHTEPIRGAAAQETPESSASRTRGPTHFQRQLQFQRKLWDWHDPQFLAGLLDRRAESE